MYTYPQSYKVKKIEEQLNILKNLFKLPKPRKGIYEVSKGGEGLFAIPHWKLIGTTYNDAVLKVMKVLKSTRQRYDYRDGNWGPQYLRQLPIKESWWNTQPEEIIVIPAQFGLQHAGKSVKSVREAIPGTELPFGMYEVLIMLLTHPQRLQSDEDLGIDCPGDEYSPGGDGVFSRASFVDFDVDRVEMGTIGVSIANDGYGSASCFVPNTMSGSENRLTLGTEKDTIEICQIRIVVCKASRTDTVQLEHDVTKKINKVIKITVHEE